MVTRQNGGIPLVSDYIYWECDTPNLHVEYMQSINLAPNIYPDRYSTTPSGNLKQEAY